MMPSYSPPDLSEARAEVPLLSDEVLKGLHTKLRAQQKKMMDSPNPQPAQHMDDLWEVLHMVECELEKRAEPRPSAAALIHDAFAQMMKGPDAKAD